MIIAIDGTAGVGKGTLGKALAEKLNLCLLDTGLLYRAVAYQMVQSKLDLNDSAQAESVASSLDLKVLDCPDLRLPEISLLASKVSAYEGVRNALMEFQRFFAHNPQKGCAGSILDGRDIGTVICPDADIKFFLTAEIEVRAHRRHLELIEKKDPITFEDLLSQMQIRDKQDSTRQIAPLTPAIDAFVIDTGEISREQVLESALSFIKTKRVHSPHL